MGPSEFLRTFKEHPEIIATMVGLCAVFGVGGFGLSKAILVDPCDREITRLKDEITRLKEQNDQLRQEVAENPPQPGDDLRELAELKEANRQLETALEEGKAQSSQVQRELYGAKSRIGNLEKQTHSLSLQNTELRRQLPGPQPPRPQSTDQQQAQETAPVVPQVPQSQEAREPPREPAAQTASVPEKAPLRVDCILRRFAHIPGVYLPDVEPKIKEDALASTGFPTDDTPVLIVKISRDHVVVFGESAMYYREAKRGRLAYESLAGTSFVIDAKHRLNLGNGDFLYLFGSRVTTETLRDMLIALQKNDCPNP